MKGFCSLVLALAAALACVMLDTSVVNAGGFFRGHGFGARNVNVNVGGGFGVANVNGVNVAVAPTHFGGFGVHAPARINAFGFVGAHPHAFGHAGFFNARGLNAYGTKTVIDAFGNVHEVDAFGNSFVRGNAFRGFQVNTPVVGFSGYGGYAIPAAASFRAFGGGHCY